MNYPSVIIALCLSLNSVVHLTSPFLYVHSIYGDSHDVRESTETPGLQCLYLPLGGLC